MMKFETLIFVTCITSLCWVALLTIELNETRAENENLVSQALARGHAVICKETLEFTWVGECKG